MNQRDVRSVGELLLAADRTTRQLLMDVRGEDGPPMLRTWGEVVQAAAELWQALPTSNMSPTGRRDAAPMTRLEAVAQGMHRAQLRVGWPGDGPADERLLEVAETFTRAADLVTRYHRQSRPVRPEVRADIDAARMRIVHCVYVGAHAVGLSAREHVRDEQVALLGVRNSQLTRAIPRGQEAVARLAAFERLASAYVGGRFATVSRGEVADPPAGIARLQEALVVWDIQAHRTLASSPTPANLVAVARTQATVALAADALLHAGAATKKIDAQAHDRVSPAMERAQSSWTRMAGCWQALIAPPTRRIDPDLGGAAAELRAALLEITHDKTALARACLPTHDSQSTIEARTMPPR